MPRRGYRKGISDRHQPKTHVVQARVTAATRIAFDAEAKARGVTTSKLTASLITAHLKQQRTALPHNTRLTDEFLRTFARLGNNLNQLARQANTGLVVVPEDELRAVLAKLTDAARSLNG